MSNFTGVTFSQQKVLPSDDAIIRRSILSDGVLYGCEFSYSGYTLTMGSGQMLLCGRQIRHPSAQNWAVNDATSGFARLVLTVDLTRTASKDVFDQVVDSIEYATDKDGFSDLVQTDVNVSGTRYQVAACIVSLGSGGITGIVEQLGPCEASGGGGLNFKVVGGLTQPANPAENTIWVATDTPISGYAFSATEPSEPSEGLVWFLVKISSTVEFNALKKEALMVYPVSAKQYNAGAWEDVVARSYQDGEWVEWIAYLYNEGDQCVDATGGWTAENNSRARWSIEETHIAAGYVDGSEGLAGSAHTSERIIFDGSKKTLSAEVEVDSPYSASIGGIFGLRDVANASAYPENAFVACKSFLTSGIVELDISGITAGSYYVTFGGIWIGRVRKVWWA